VDEFYSGFDQVLKGNRKLSEVISSNPKSSSSSSVNDQFHVTMLENLSELLKINWLRVVLDEGHVMGSGHLTYFIEMAGCIESKNRWVMTGTPTPTFFLPSHDQTQRRRSSTPDFPPAMISQQETEFKHLFHLFKFLRLDPCYSPFGSSTDDKLWKKLIGYPIKSQIKLTNQSWENVLDCLNGVNQLDEEEEEEEMVDFGISDGYWRLIHEMVWNFSNVQKGKWTLNSSIGRGNFRSTPLPPSISNLHSILSNSMIRHFKSSILSHVPPPTHTTILLKMNENETNLYNLFVNYAKMNLIITSKDPTNPGKLHPGSLIHLFFNLFEL